MTPPSDRSLAQRLEGLNLYLVGMMGTGKSALGHPLAEALPSILKERAIAPETPALLSNADGAITQSLN